MTKLSIARGYVAINAPYLNAALYGFHWKPSVEVLTVDLKGSSVVYNPVYLDTAPAPLFAAEVVKELWRVLRVHGTRAKGPVSNAAGGDTAAIAYYRELWKSASEAEIYDDLAQMTGFNGKSEPFPVPDHGVTPKRIGTGTGGTVEDYFEHLKKKLQSPDTGGLDPHGGSGLFSSGGDEAGENKDGPEGNGGASPLDEIQLRAMREAVAAALRERAKQAGRLPAGMQRWLDEILKPPVVRWQDELSAQVRRMVSAIRAGNADYTFRRINKKAMARGVILPTMYAPQPAVGIVIDTSGSMSQADLSDSISEVAGILRSITQAQVLSCDAAASAAQKVFDAKTINLVGGGGTDMGVGLEAAAKLEVDLAVCLTDGFTPWPAENPLGRRKVIVVIVGDKGRRGYGSGDEVVKAVPKWAKALDARRDRS
jgi:nucleotide-binding universal stress UspA family protein